MLTSKSIEMLDKSFGLLLYVKKPKNYLKGDVPIYLRITVDGVSFPKNSTF